METIDEQLLQQENTHHLKFVSLWPRAGATFLDGLLFSPLIFLTYYNALHWKSIVIMITVSLLQASYKPMCEYLFGFTLAKKWLGQCVINEDGLKPTLAQALLRNVFQLSSVLVTIFTSVLIFQHPEFLQVETYSDYNQFLVAHNDYQWFQYAVSALFVVDAIVLWRDPQRRSIHDKIATTWVVKA